MRTQPFAQRMVIAIMLVAACALPASAHAQSAADLRASIRTEIMKDPRTASLSEAEIEGLVNALSAGAAAEGVESRQFTTTDYPAAAPAPVPACGGMPAFLCVINDSFGFDDSAPAIPITLLATSGLLAFLLSELRLHIREHGHAPLH